MFNLIQRYSASSVIFSLLVVWLVLSAVVSTLIFGDKWDNLLEHRATLKQSITYFVCVLPQTTFVVFPAICLIGTQFGMLALSRHQELTAMFAAGASLRWIGRPVIVLAVLIGMGSFYWNEYIAAPLSRYGQQLMLTEIQKKKGIFKDYGLLRGTNNRFIRYDEFLVSDQILTNFVLHEMRPNGGGHRRFIRADRARWDPFLANPATGQDGAWRLDAINPDAENFKIIVHDDWRSEVLPLEDGEPLYLEETPSDFGVFERMPIEMSYRELRRRIESLEAVGGSVLSLYPELYFKISFPSAITALILIGLATGASQFLIGREGAARFTYPLAISMMVLFAYYGAVSICLALGKLGHLAPLLSAALPSIGLFATSLWLLWRE